MVIVESVTFPPIATPPLVAWTPGGLWAPTSFLGGKAYVKAAHSPTATVAKPPPIHPRIARFLSLLRNDQSRFIYTPVRLPAFRIPQNCAPILSQNPRTPTKPARRAPSRRGHLPRPGALQSADRVPVKAAQSLRNGSGSLAMVERRCAENSQRAKLNLVALHPGCYHVVA